MKDNGQRLHFLFSCLVFFTFPGSELYLQPFRNVVLLTVHTKAGVVGFETCAGGDAAVDDVFPHDSKG